MFSHGSHFSTYKLCARTVFLWSESSRTYLSDIRAALYVDPDPLVQCECWAHICHVVCKFNVCKLLKSLLKDSQRLYNPGYT